MTSPRLLVVDDDPDVRDSLSRALRYAGYQVITAIHGGEALDVVARSPVDLIVLDVLMPIMDGFEACRRLRERGDATPVLVLTARDSVDDRVTGLDAGADDYLVKPFDLDELFARVRALHRRVTEDEAQPLRVGGLVLDPASRRTSRDGVEIELSAREFDILELLMRRAGRVVTRFTILDEVWDGETDLRSNVIDVHVAGLRAKIDKPFGTQTITTLRGSGYRLETT